MATSDIRIVRHLEERLWRDFLESNASANIFHTPEMYEVFARADGHRPALWAAVKGTDRVLALVLPVEIVLYRWLPRLTSRDVAYGGVLYEPGSLGREGLSLLLDRYRADASGRALFAELRNVSDSSAVQLTLRERGFGYEDHLNYLIDLDRTPEEVLGTMSSRTRKHVRRGLRKEEVDVRVARDHNELDLSYELLRRTYHHAGVPLAPRALFEAAFEVLGPKGMVKFLLAYVEDVPVSTSVELIFKDVIYGWYSGVDREFSSHNPNEMIMWHILSWGADNGYRQYDFGGAGKPDEDYGVRDFKAKFGGELVNFGRNKYVPSPVRLKISALGYEVVRRIPFP